MNGADDAHVWEKKSMNSARADFLARELRAADKVLALEILESSDGWRRSPSAARQGMSPIHFRRGFDSLSFE